MSEAMLHLGISLMVMNFINSYSCWFFLNKKIYVLQVNLCFDQFVYKLSDQIFAYYKHLAGR